jgi:hypothetical protein
VKILPKYRPELCVFRFDDRPQLEDPYLDAEERKVVATNGHALVAVPVEVAEGEQSGFLSRVLLRIARRWFKRERDPSGSKPVEIVGDRVPNGPSYPTIQDRGAAFPNWKEVFPKRAKGEAGTVTVGLDAFYLKDIALALGGEDRPGGCQVQVTIDITGGAGWEPFLVRLNEGDEAAVGVLMPVRFSAEHGSVWFVPEKPADPPPPEELRAQVYDAVKYALDRIQEDADFGYYAGFGTEVFHRLVKAEAAHLGKPLPAWHGQLASVLGGRFMCKVFLASGRGFYVVGRKTNREVLIATWEYLRAEIRRLGDVAWRGEAAKHRHLREKLKDSPELRRLIPDAKRWKRGFAFGAIGTIAQRLADAQKRLVADTSGAAIVLARRMEEVDAFVKAEMKTKPARGIASPPATGYRAGQAAAHALDLSPRAGVSRRLPGATA